MPEAVAPEPKGEDIALDIVFEDDDIIVIDKPRGLVVHPAAGHETGTLVNALIGKYGQPDGVNGGDYYWFSNKYLTRNGNFQTGCTLAMDNYAGPMPDVYAGEDNDDPSGSAVSYLVNYYEKNANLADCGQILKYRITNSNDGQHIDSLEATLVDFPAAQAAVTVFADAFWKRAKAAEDAKLNSDAAIKPNI